jgi:hypothetical protein
VNCWRQGTRRIVQRVGSSLMMNWSNIEKWRKLLKIGTIATIVLLSMLKYYAKLKKIDRGILKLLPFKVSGYFTLMRNRSMLVYKLIKNIFQNGQFFLNFSHIKYRFVEFSNEFTKKVGRGFSM